MIIELIQNNIILSCFLTWVITQTSKGLIISYKNIILPYINDYSTEFMGWSRAI